MYAVIIKLKYVAIGEALIIVLLLILLYNPHQLTREQLPNQRGLLSPRVYTGLIEPQSYLIVNYIPLRTELESYIKKNHYNVSVYIVNMRDGASMGINEKQPFYGASLSKVPLAMLIMNEIEEGTLTLDTVVPIKDNHRTNSWGTLNTFQEKEATVDFLLRKMLQESDNTAFNVLLDLKDREDETNLLWEYLGLYGAAEGTIQGTAPITAKSFYNVFSSLYLSTILTPEHSEYILSLLTQTSLDLNKIAQLPENVTVAHKFGANYGGDLDYFHDCGIMYIGDMRVFFCILSKDIPLQEAAANTGFIVKVIYEYSVHAREEWDDYRTWQNSSQ